MVTEIVLLRHGITEGNLKHWFYGSIDLPLAEEGFQAIEENREMNRYPVLPEHTQVFTSGLTRTRQTLQAVYGELPYEVIPEFAEYKFGIYEGKSFQELQHSPGFMAWVNDKTEEYVLEGGESRGAFSRRIIKGCDILLKKHAAYCEKLGEFGTEEAGRPSLPSKTPPILTGPTTLVVCHGGVISQIMRHWFNRPMEEIWDWVPEPGSGSVVELLDGSPTRYQLIMEADRDFTGM